jgi:hypothetical protein
MMRMRRLAWLVMFLGLASSGCCWWADHTCPNCHNQMANQSPPVYYSQPCCPQYANPCCPVGYQAPAGPGSQNCCTPH